MFFVHRILNAVTMMYNEAEELTACHFIRPSTYLKQSAAVTEPMESKPDPPLLDNDQDSSSAEEAPLVTA